MALFLQLWYNLIKLEEMANANCNTQNKAPVP